MRNVLEAKTQVKTEKEDEGLRAMLEDFVLIAEHLAPLCDDNLHMVEVVKGALNSDSQLQFLANVLKKSAKK